MLFPPLPPRQHIGPAIPEVSSIWFKLYVYHVTGQGPPSLLLSKGSRLRKLPDIFQVSRQLGGVGGRGGGEGGGGGKRLEPALGSRADGSDQLCDGVLL